MKLMKVTKLIFTTSAAIGLSGSAISVVSCHKKKGSHGQNTTFMEFKKQVEATTATNMWKQISTNLQAHKMSHINIENPSNNLKIITINYSDNNKSTINLNLTFQSTGIIKFTQKIILQLPYQFNKTYSLNDWNLNYTFDDWYETATETTSTNKILPKGQQYQNKNGIVVLNNNAGASVKSENPQGLMSPNRFMVGKILMAPLDKFHKTKLFGDDGQSATANWWTFTADPEGKANYKLWQTSWHAALIKYEYDPSGKKAVINRTNVLKVLRNVKKLFPKKSQQLLNRWNLSDKGGTALYFRPGKPVPNDSDKNGLKKNYNYGGEIDITDQDDAGGQYIEVKSNYLASWTSFDPSQFNILLTPSDQS